MKKKIKIIYNEFLQAEITEYPEGFF